ncbi:MAG: OmpA family protein [Chitinophagales bacterium]
MLSFIVKLMMKFSVCIFSLLLPFIASSQNLLANGSFEDENICTEYHINCSPEAWISTLSNFNVYFKDVNRAHTGSHCMAIEAGHFKIHFDRTFIRSQLLCKLRKGHQYRIEFFAKSRYDILDSIGVIFTSFDFLFLKDLPYKMIPTLYVADGPNKFIKGDSSWQKVTLDFTAWGTEEYITLGNFSKKDITGETGIKFENNFLIFFDDISLTPLDPNENICTDWEKTKEAIYDQDERHQYLDRLIKLYRSRNRFPESPELSSTSVIRIDTLVLPDILFASGKADLQQSSYSLLYSFCQRMIGKQVDSLVVEGHTDSTGSLQLNAKLSLDRAQSVANYFLSKAVIKQNQATTRGWGSSKPIAENRSQQGRQKNRRVEIFLYIRE